MPSSSPINRRIRRTFDKRRDLLGRVKGDANPYTSKSAKAKENYLKGVQKTPYLYMLSTESIQEKRRNAKETQKKFDAREEENKTERLQKEDIVEDRTYLGDWSGPILISNTEYSEDEKDGGVGKEMKFGEDAYKARGERKYRPNAGIKGLSSEYLSSGQQAFVRKVTVNWTCFTLEDLNILQERFMTLGRKVYVEWGWASTKMNKKPVFLRNYRSELGSYSVNDDLVNDNEIKDSKGNVIERISAAQKLKDKVLIAPL